MADRWTWRMHGALHPSVQRGGRAYGVFRGACMLMCRTNWWGQQWSTLRQMYYPPYSVQVAEEDSVVTDKELLDESRLGPYQLVVLLVAMC